MKPAYQKLIEIFIPSSLILFGLVEIYESITKAVEIFSLRKAAILTLSLLIIYSLLTILLIKKKISWVTKSGELIRIISIGKKIKWSILVAILMIWIAAGINYFNLRSTTISLRGTKENKEPIFKYRDSGYKILVLPFKKDCDYLDVTYDVGNVISRRLKLLSEEDSLNLSVEYLDDSTIIKNFTTKIADSLLTYHRADQIIYGSYSLIQCESNDSAKICFNYRLSKDGRNTLNNNLTQYRENIKTSYKVMSFGGIEDLASGQGQEEIDYIIFLVTGISEYQKGKYENAIQRFKKVHEYEKKEKLCIYLSSAYINIRDYANALEVVDKILTNSPCNFDAISLKYFLLVRKGNLLSAKKMLDNSISCDSNNVQVLSMLASHYFFMGSVSKGLATINKAFSVDSGFSNNWYVFGEYKRLNNEYLVAKDYFKRAVDLDSLSYYKWHQLGALYSDLDSLDKAIECTLRAHALNTKYDYSLFLLGKLFFQKRMYQEAKFYNEEGLKLSPDNFWGWIQLGHTNGLGLKNDTAAIIAYNKAISIDPKNDMPQLNLGTIYLNQGDIPQAAKYYRKALSLNPEGPLTNFNIAVIYSIEKNKTKTLYHLAKAFRVEPSLKRQTFRANEFKWLFKDPDFLKLIS